MAIIFIILVIFLAGQYSGISKSLQNAASQNLPASQTPSGGQNAVSLSALEVAKHNTEQDCWFIISGKVYDVTAYINQHPGGRNQIIPFCGHDATTAFATKNGQGSHSSSANQLLNAYLLGNFGGSTSQDQLQKVKTTVPQNINSGKLEAEEDDD